MEDRAEDHGDVDRDIFDENVKTVVASRDENRHQDEGDKRVGQPIRENQHDADDPEENEAPDDLPPERDDEQSKEKDRSVKVGAKRRIFVQFCGKKGFFRFEIHKPSFRAALVSVNC